MKPKTLREPENINDIPEERILHTLTKPRAHQSIVFVEDGEDPWFVEVKYYKTKTGEVTDSETILGKEVDGWLKWLTNLKYEVKK